MSSCGIRPTVVAPAGPVALAVPSSSHVNNNSAVQSTPLASPSNSGNQAKPQVDPAPRASVAPVSSGGEALLNSTSGAAFQLTPIPSATSDETASLGSPPHLAPSPTFVDSFATCTNFDRRSSVTEHSPIISKDNVPPSAEAPTNSDTAVMPLPDAASNQTPILGTLPDPTAQIDISNSCLACSSSVSNPSFTLVAPGPKSDSWSSTPGNSSPLSSPPIPASPPPSPDGVFFFESLLGRKAPPSSFKRMKPYEYLPLAALREAFLNHKSTDGSFVNTGNEPTITSAEYFKSTSAELIRFRFNQTQSLLPGDLVFKSSFAGAGAREHNHSAGLRTRASSYRRQLTSMILAKYASLASNHFQFVQTSDVNIETGDQIRLVSSQSYVPPLPLDSTVVLADMISSRYEWNSWVLRPKSTFTDVMWKAMSWLQRFQAQQLYDNGNLVPIIPNSRARDALVPRNISAPPTISSAGSREGNPSPRRRAGSIFSFKGPTQTQTGPDAIPEPTPHLKESDEEVEEVMSYIDENFEFNLRKLHHEALRAQQKHIMATPASRQKRSDTRANITKLNHVMDESVKRFEELDIQRKRLEADIATMESRRMTKDKQEKEGRVAEGNGGSDEIKNREENVGAVVGSEAEREGREDRGGQSRSESLPERAAPQRQHDAPTTI